MLLGRFGNNSLRLVKKQGIFAKKPRNFVVFFNIMYNPYN